MDLGPFQESVREKIVRMSDVLVQMYSVPYLREHLALFGGTALNFLHLDTPRLSVDIDMNYRHSGDTDWGDDRSRIDEHTKNVLTDLGYDTDRIRIQPTYPLSRIEVGYVNSLGTS